MKKKIKSYLVFSSFSYKVCIFLLMPAVLAGVGIGIGSFCGEPGLTATAMLLTMAEILSDHWLFSGLMAKESERMDVLRTSDMGMEIMKNALILDLLRKLLTAFGILAVCELFTGQWGGLLLMAMVSYVFSTAGTFLARYGGGLAVNACIGQISALLVLGCLLCVYRSGLWRFRVGLELLFLVLGVLVSVLTVSKAMRKVKGGYYDQ